MADGASERPHRKGEDAEPDSLEGIRFRLRRIESVFPWLEHVIVDDAGDDEVTGLSWKERVRLAEREQEALAAQVEQLKRKPCCPVCAEEMVVLAVPSCDCNVDGPFERACETATLDLLALRAQRGMLFGHGVAYGAIVDAIKKTVRFDKGEIRFENPIKLKAKGANDGGEQNVGSDAPSAG